MSVRVGPLQAEDHGPWLVLWAAYLEFYETQISAEVTAETWRRLLAHSHPFQGLGAFAEDGRLLGIAHYFFHPVTWAIPPRCYLEDLFVRSEARGKGAGRALIEAVYRAADELGSDQVYWLTAESNVVARRLYDRVGRLTPFVKYRR